jgi:hypothetical protein
LNLDQAEALWAVGRLPREGLPEVATAALLAGVEDSPSLRVLAGLAAAELDRAWDLFAQALQELGRPPPLARMSVQWAAVTQAQAIVSGTVPRASA